MTDRFTRARHYVEAISPAVAGNHGHHATFKVALALVHGFALSESEAMPIMQKYNERCDPRWSPKELEHKLRSAAQWPKHTHPRGHLLGSSWKPASSSPTQPPKGGSVRWVSDMSEELPGATIARHWAEEAPKPPVTSAPSASSPEQASDASPPRGDEKATVAPPSGVASHKQSIANPSMASATRNSLPIYAANPEIARIILSQSAELGRQPDFRADSNHLGLAYMVHHILQCALREEIILPPGIDRIAASRFVEAVFAAAHRLFREPGINAAETAQPSRPLARERNPQVDAAQGSWF